MCIKYLLQYLFVTKLLSLAPTPQKGKKNTLKHMDFVLSTLITAIIYFNKNVAISFACYKFFMKRKTQLKNSLNLIKKKISGTSKLHIKLHYIVG